MRVAQDVHNNLELCSTGYISVSMRDNKFPPTGSEISVSETAEISWLLKSTFYVVSAAWFAAELRMRQISACSFGDHVTFMPLLASPLMNSC